MNEELTAQIRDYAKGSLSNEEAAELEARALEDPEIAKAIEAELAPVGRAFRELFPPPEIPESAIQSVQEICAGLSSRKPGTLRLGILTAVAVAAVAMWFLVPRPVVVTLDSTDGAVFANGVALSPGSSVPYGEEILCINPARFELGDINAPTGPGLTVFTVDRAGNRIVFRPRVGDFAFSGHSDRVRYLVVSSGVEARPLGTRFSVRANGGSTTAVSVYASRVEVTHQASARVISKGYALTGRRLQHIEDDPITKLMDKVPVPTEGGLVLLPRLPLPPPEDALIAKVAEAARIQNSAERYARLALCLANFQEKASAASAVRLAMSADKNLSSLTDAELLSLARSQVGQGGDAEVAGRVIGVIESRPTAKRTFGPDYFDALRDLAQNFGSNWQKAVDAARKLEGFHKWGDQLAIAETYLYAGISLGNDRQLLSDAERRLREVLISDRAVLDKRYRAVACHRLGEALYHSTQKQESLQWTLRATEAWPIPRWLVHAATRLAETNARSREECFRLLSEGLRRDPSSYTYERALTAVHAFVRDEHDRRVEYELSKWIADTFASVPMKQVEMAVYFAQTFEDFDEAERLFERGSALFGGVDKIPMRFRVEMGICRYRAGRKESAYRLAGIEDPATSAQAKYDFFRGVGQFKDALIYHEQIPMENRGSEYGYNRAELLARLNRKQEALQWLRECADKQAALLEAEGWTTQADLLLMTLLRIGELTDNPSERAAAIRRADWLLKMGPRSSYEFQAQWMIWQSRLQILKKDLVGASKTLGELDRRSLIPGLIEQKNEVRDRLEALTGGRRHRPL